MQPFTGCCAAAILFLHLGIRCIASHDIFAVVFTIQNRRGEDYPICYDPL